MAQAESKKPQASYLDELEAEVQYLREQLKAAHELLNESKAMVDSYQRLTCILTKEIVKLENQSAIRDKYIQQLHRVKGRANAFFDKAHAPKASAAGNEWGAIDS